VQTFFYLNFSEKGGYQSEFENVILYTEAIDPFTRYGMGYHHDHVFCNPSRPRRSFSEREGDHARGTGGTGSEIRLGQACFPTVSDVSQGYLYKI
jgi:hypothetical protein